MLRPVVLNRSFSLTECLQTIRGALMYSVIRYSLYVVTHATLVLWHVAGVSHTHLSKDMSAVELIISLVVMLQMMFAVEEFSTRK